VNYDETDYDNLRTGTAIGFRASCELCSNYLLNIYKVSHFKPVLKFLLKVAFVLDASSYAPTGVPLLDCLVNTNVTPPRHNDVTPSTHGKARS